MKDTINIEWHVDDVMSRDVSLTILDARIILESLKDNHDASIGINWDVIDGEIESYLEILNDGK